MSYSSEVVKLYEDKCLKSKDFTISRIFKNESYISIKEKILSDLEDSLNSVNLDSELLKLQKDIDKIDFLKIHLKKAVQIFNQNNALNTTDNKDSITCNIFYGAHKLKFWVNYNPDKKAKKSFISQPNSNKESGFKHSVVIEPVPFQTKSFTFVQGYSTASYSLNDSTNLFKVGLDSKVVECINEVVCSIINKDSKIKKSFEALDKIRNFIEMNFQHALYFEVFSSPKEMSVDYFLDRLIENSELIILEDKKIRGLDNLVSLRKSYATPETTIIKKAP